MIFFVCLLNGSQQAFCHIGYIFKYFVICLSHNIVKFDNSMLQCKDIIIFSSLLKVSIMGHSTSSGTTFWSNLTSPTQILMKIGSHVRHMERRKTCKFLKKFTSFSSFHMPNNYFLRHDLSKF